MAKPSGRPLSPHLSIWRWGPAMLISILHRATGDGMAVLGGILLVGWLLALASGPEGYAWYVGWATSPIGYLLMIGLSWAFFQHMCSGLRHFVLDIGAGYEVDGNNRWSALLPVVAIALTAILWSIIFFV
ncbi:succinate dehydrogenase, cytochrome b556 subunit [Blastomonas aquatica]|nr:succinate dehydrogenase, cytochrome b556 subunit [Blastomonas aquatica]